MTTRGLGRAVMPNISSNYDATAKAFVVVAARVYYFHDFMFL